MLKTAGFLNFYLWSPSDIVKYKTGKKRIMEFRINIEKRYQDLTQPAAQPCYMPLVDEEDFEKTLIGIGQYRLMRGNPCKMP